ncbi:MAG TPA: amidase [Roseiflexaceae bacterium]|nr:amidase [Roseiflexaceae bacterium]
MSSAELCFQSAVELARRIHAREVSALEVLHAHLAQIERVNPQVNAIVTLLPDMAEQQARAADAALARGEAIGVLHGLPIAHKDLVNTRGIRTTRGSPIYRDFVPEANDLIVDRIQAAGAITIGKTNTPEFGAGSQTFNPVFGATRNPYDRTRTCGGSSGGAAVALACGMIPIADGSDMGGSLRNPAGYCNVVGLRPSPGRVPIWPSDNKWQPLSVEGPMARQVADVALLLSAIAGPDARVPNSLSDDGALFRRPLERDFRGVRVAWSRDLGGLPFDRRVTAALEGQRATLEALGCVVEDASPDLSGADEAFKLWRAFSFAMGHADHLKQHRDLLKDTVIWNTEQGLQLSGLDLVRATRLLAHVFDQMQAFMTRYDFLVCPVSQVPPFSVDVPYPTEIDGVVFDTYIDWMQSCYLISATSHPAASVPGGFTEDGLPVGLQIVGRYRDEWSVLQLGYAIEQASGLWRHRPDV